MHDNQIIDLFWARSETTIHEIDTQYGVYLKSIVRNILTNAQDTEECINDVYLQAWRSIPPQRPAFLSAYLGKIARNLALHQYQKCHAQKRGGGQWRYAADELYDTLAASDFVDEHLQTELLAQTISDFLHTCSKKHRVIFVRRYWYADSIAAIAARMDLSESAVKSILFRYRNRLREYLLQESILS